MSFISKLKSKFLNHSDMHNHYKNETVKLSNDLDNELKDLKHKFKKYKKKQNAIQKSNNKLFNTLFLDYELIPKGTLKLTQELCLELLDFYVNVCNKYNLEFWFDYGTILGAYIHGSFIPWDDDIDVGMMRKDCIKFNEIFEDELEIHNLENIITIRKKTITPKKNVISFSQILIIKNNSLFAGLDVFPCDYIINPQQDIEKQYKKAKKEYSKNLYNNIPKEEVIKILYNNLNCSYEKQEYFFTIYRRSIWKQT